jgi:hypothetical protein
MLPGIAKTYADLCKFSFTHLNFVRTQPNNSNTNSNKLTEQRSKCVTVYSYQLAVKIQNSYLNGLGEILLHTILITYVHKMDMICNFVVCSIPLLYRLDDTGTNSTRT